MHQVRMRAVVSCAAVAVAVAVLLALPAVAPAAIRHGGPGPDSLNGTEGNDVLRGMAGADRLDGRGGADRLYGGAGADRISADAADRVVAGAGRDEVSLDASARRFSVACGPGRDRLTVRGDAALTRKAVRRRARGCEHVAVLAVSSRPRFWRWDRRAPSAVRRLAVSTRTQTSLGLRWEAATDNVGVAGYRVYRDGALAGTTTSLRYTLDRLACGTGYTLAVSAVDAAANESARTAVSGATGACDPAPQPTPQPTPSPTPSPSTAPAPDTQAPSVPQGMAWTTKTKTSLGLRWDAASDNVGVTGYRIYRDDVRIATTTKLSYTLTGLTCGTSYTVGLTAIDAAGNESYRPEAVGTTSTSACDAAPSPSPSPTPSPTPTPTPEPAPEPTPEPAPEPTPGPAPAPSGPANVFVTTSGADGNACSSAAPCQSLARAYAVAKAGDVVSVAAGSYGEQEVPDGTKAVTFRGAPGAKLRKLSNHAANVTYDGIEIDAGFASIAAFENHAAPNVTFKNARIGNVTDDKAALLGGSEGTAPLNLVIDNVDFHDVLVTDSGVHNECVYSQTSGLTVRNSTFRNCATFDIFVTRGDWWGQPLYGGVTLENNVFGHATNTEGASSWHHYSLAINDGVMRQMRDFRVVNNTFETPVGGANYANGASGVWANNVGSWECIAGITYRNNAGSKCDASDKAVSPAASCGQPACSNPQTGAYGWRDPARFDFHLTAGSPAIDVGSATYAPTLDHDGKARNGPPDAGAFEY